MIKGILFDFDGVTIKSMEQHFSAWRSAFAEKGIVLKKEDLFVLEGQGITTISHTLGRLYGLNESQINEVRDRKVTYYQELMSVEFYDYFFELLSNLKSKQMKMGVVTGGLRKRVEKIIKTYFNGTFDCLVTVDDVLNGKPHPEPFLKGAELLHLAPGECLVVENAPMGIESAVKAGMIVIAVTTTLTAPYLKQAHYIVNDFREVERIITSLTENGPVLSFD